MKVCERCGKLPEGWGLHDYCAKCSQDLCINCMEEGCCGQSPAISGAERDDEESPDIPEQGIESDDMWQY